MDANADAALDRAVGALLGLACGDAVGTTVEFQPPGSFTPVADMVGGGPFGLRPGQWTDDTSLALCLAESVLDTGDLDLHDQLRRYVLWWREGYLSSTGRCFDIGNATRAQLSRFERTGEAVDAEPDQEQAANGSLMRLAAVPIRWHADVAEAAEMAGESSRTTHPAARPVDACRLMGAMVAGLIDGTDADAVFAPGFWQWGSLHPAIEQVARGRWRAKQPPEIRGTGYCVDALEAAIWAVAGAPDFRSAVLRAVNLGDDADTTAAIAGQLAGARWGASSIPAGWRERVTFSDRIAALATNLFRAAGGDVPARWPHDDLVHAWWVEPHTLLAGEYPAHPARGRAEVMVNLLVDWGVRTFVDLTSPAHPLEPYSDVVDEVGGRRRLDLRWRRFPIPDFDVLDDDEYDAIVDTIAAEKQRGAVYVHCWGGIGRTGTVIGCLLADGGLDADGVLARLVDLRTGTRKAHRESPESPSQKELVRRRALRRLREAGTEE